MSSEARSPVATEGGKRIVVVLGMHRSGTSAVARGLKTLGVELGERLMPPAANNNEKGFWEDIDANALDNDLLAHLGHSWDSLGPLEGPALLRDDLGPFRLRAVELLREKLAGVTVFGMKDPRISRLLPFWKAAFAHLGAQASYVISARHPLSVARSLGRRDEMGAEKSHYLWLEHLVGCVRDTAGAARVVLDYDLLMQEPEGQLRRVAAALGIPFEPSAEGMREYAGEFLAPELRHSVYRMEDLELAPGVPGEVVEAYGLLQRLGRDELSLEAPEVAAAFERFGRRLDEMRPAFAYINRTDREFVDYRAAALHEREAASQEREAHLASIAALEQEVAHLEATLAESARELEMNRLRLLDSLRHGARESARAARLEASVEVLEAELAAMQAKVPARVESGMKNLAGRVTKRLGAFFAPRSRLRAALRDPGRALRQLVRPSAR